MSAAFPLMATGSFLLLLGMFSCAFVIDKPTWEARLGMGTIYGGHNAEFWLLWLQRGRAVNDQIFHSYAILADGERDTVLRSSRLRPDGIKTTYLATLSLAGVFLSFAGFVLQFTGLRLMNWSATLAQLIGVCLMTIIRSIMRQELAEKPKKAFRLKSSYELDELALGLVLERDNLWKGKDSKIPDRWCLAVNEQKWLEPDPSKARDRSTVCGQSSVKALDLWETRQTLRSGLPWPTRYSQEAGNICRAFNSIVKILEHLSQENRDEFDFKKDKLVCKLEGQFLEDATTTAEFSLELAVADSRKFKVQVEAALSLWGYPVSNHHHEVLYEMQKTRERSITRDSRLWKTTTATGLLLFGLQPTDTRPTTTTDHLAPSILTTPSGETFSCSPDRLLAQNLFLALMDAFAEHIDRLPLKPEITLHSSREDNLMSFDSVRLRHPTLDAMVEKIQQADLASAGEAWDLVIAPLSLHGKLPDPMCILDAMRDDVLPSEQAGRWKRVANGYKEIMKLGLAFNYEPDKWVYRRAAAQVVDAYRRLRSILDVQERQRRRERNIQELQMAVHNLRKAASGIELPVRKLLREFYGLRDQMVTDNQDDEHRELEAHEQLNEDLEDLLPKLEDAEEPER